MHILLLAILLAAAPLQAPAGVVTGRIRLTNGLPAVGMRVSAMLAPDAARKDAADAGALFSQTQTDETGHYRLESVPPGRYFIMAGRVDAPTYYPGKTDTDTATAISIASGSPVEGIDFTISELSTQIPATGGQVFVLPSVPNLEVAVRFKAEPGSHVPFRSPHGRTQVSAKPTTNFLTAGPATTVSSGTIRVAVLTTTPTATATLQPDGSAALKVSAGEYRFSVENLPDDYEVKSILYGSADLLAQAMQVASPVSAEVRVTLGPRNPPLRRTGRLVSGRILDGTTGKAWFAESVSLSGATGTVFLDGGFEFPGIPAGRYVLQAREGLPGDRTAEASVVVGTSDVTMDLTYTSLVSYVRVEGRVSVEGGGSIRNGGFIVITSTSSTPLAVASDGAFRTALREGAYRVALTNFPVGFFVKSITSGAVNLLDQPLVIRPADGPAVPDILVTLSPIPRVKVRGRVIADPPTRPVAGAEVLLTGGPENYRTTAAADGTFEMPRVLPGTYGLAIRPFGFTHVNAEIVVADQDLNLEFRSQPAY